MLETMPLFLSGVLGMLIGLVCWELFRSRRQASGESIVLSLLAIGCFTLGVFVTYLLLTTHFP